MRGIGRVDWPVKDYTSLQFEIKTNLATKEIQVSARGKNTFCRDAFCLSDVCGFFMFLINQRDQCRRRYLSEAFEVMLEKLETGGSMSNKERREIKNTTGQHVARILEVFISRENAGHLSTTYRVQSVPVVPSSYFAKNVTHHTGCNC